MSGDFDRRRTSFGARAADYDRVRPGYPDVALRSVIGRPLAHGGARVLDLGAGTGRLAAACAALGANVIAAEPDAGMATLAARAVPRRVVRATAEHLPVAGASLDAIVVGQAWHWFDPHDAVVECARILRRGGRLGVFRNVRDESEPWVAALGDIIGGPDRTREAAGDIITIGEPFTAVEHEDFPHRRTMAAGDLVTLAMTHSYVAVHPQAAELQRCVEQLVAEHPDLAGRTQIEMPYVCRLTRATRG